ncbi:nuclear transport factor 2 family protein [Novosphingobium terrae]|uniref:nuclear transport factor 2 family protein n=1 Tax=Novosphingobium terrae TaxID=2726189 RepID=UPI00197F2D13|nr:nuclear transport factor 2 family protein [Novosphingobium terrae]
MQRFPLSGQALALAFLIASPASAEPASRATEQKLLEAEDALFAADIHHDVAAIERGFADEAVFVHANGMMQTKADYIEAARHPKFSPSEITTERRTVRIFGKVGVVRGIKKLTAGPMHLSGSYLAVYVLRDGRWQMLEEQSAPAYVPPAVPNP